MNINILRCLDCGAPFPIPRNNKTRGENHIKTIFCPSCQKKTQFIENINMETVGEEIKEKIKDWDK